MILRISLLFLLLCAILDYGQAVMTPTVKIKEEKPTTGSSLVRKNAAGQIEVIGLVGQPVILECIPYYISSTAKVHWQWTSKKGNMAPELINDGMRAKDTSRWTITRGQATKNAIRLEIPTVSVAYEGTLQCTIDYIENSQIISAERILLVYAMPTIVQYQSSFETTVDENNNATLRCNATGIPKPTIFWRRIGGSSSLIPGYGREHIGTSISFSKTKPGDRGLYLCQAANAMGSASWSVNLLVRFKPRVTIFTGSTQTVVKQKVGCDKQIQCIVTSNPAPGKNAITWSSPSGRVVDDKRRVRIYEMAAADYTTYYTLSFEPSQASDFQTYTCSATNAQGTSSKSVTLQASSIAERDMSGLVRCKSIPTAIPSAWLLSFVLLLLTRV